MYESYSHHEVSPYHIEPLAATAAPVEQGVAETHSTDAAPGREADPYEVIDFLLKKAEEQQARLNDHEAFIELQNQELESLKGQLDATAAELAAKKDELERQLADYDVLMQNTLAVEHELDQLRVRATEKPTIKLPFYTEQKLAKLGFGEGHALEEREAV